MATFDPQAVKVFYGPLILHGFMDGTMIQVAQDEATFSKHIGGDGEGCRVRNRNEGGKITVTLQQSSPSNDDLSTMHNADKLTGIGQQSVMVKDLRGTLLVSASEAWLEKFADISIGKEIEGREWTIDCMKLRVVSVGSALV
jgi:hypothetical protein